MADNLKFLLATQYKDAKVIAWAANTHIMKRTDQVPKGKKLDLILRNKMGTYFVQDPQWARQTYVPSLASYQGTTGRLGEAAPLISRFQRDLRPSRGIWCTMACSLSARCRQQQRASRLRIPAYP